MKKIIIILTIILFITGCSLKKEEVKTPAKINLIKDEISYASKVKLSDIISIENGSLKKDIDIDTLKLGSLAINFKYLDENQKEVKSSINVKIVDDTKPLLLHRSKYTIVKGKDTDILKSVICGDNYDRDLSCSIIGQYDNNTIGEYELSVTAKDSSGNETISPFKVEVIEKQNNTSTGETSRYELEDLIKKYKNDKTMIGIDVSSWQGDINWSEVKSSGVEFAMIRIGHGSNSDGTYELDNKFINNLKNAKEAGIKVGIYYYSKALTMEDAVKQADWIIDNLNNEKLDLPISFDWESWSSFNDFNLSYTDLNLIAKAFMDEVSKRGYDAINYGSASYLEKIWNITEYPTWLAYYTSKNDYSKDYYIWQLSNTGRVPGIDGNVDLDILYKK